MRELHGLVALFPFVPGVSHSSIGQSAQWVFSPFNRHVFPTINRPKGMGDSRSVNRPNGMYFSLLTDGYFQWSIGQMGFRGLVWRMGKNVSLDRLIGQLGNTLCSNWDFLCNFKLYCQAFASHFHSSMEQMGRTCIVT